MRLTDVEFELMTILWKLGKGSVKDVMGALPENRKLAYTSVSTMLRILVKKNALRAVPEGRSHIYIPLLQRDKFKRETVHDMVETIFEKNPVDLVKNLIDVGGLKGEDLRQIQNLIAANLKKRS